MNILTNWRYYVLTAMMAVGALLVFAAGGDFTVSRDLATEMLCRIIFAAAGFALLYAMHRLTRLWECEDKIPEFTNQKYE